MDDRVRAVQGIAITLNGKPRRLDGPMSVPVLLESLGANPKQVAVALNGEVVRRSEWPRTKVGDGDAVEIVRAVGGGSGNSFESGALDPSQECRGAVRFQESSLRESLSGREVRLRVTSG